MGGYSGGEMEALTALCDTILPSIDLPHHHHHRNNPLFHFFQTSASMTATPLLVAEFVQEKVEHPKIQLSRLALWALSTWIGTFLLCGTKSLSPHFPYFQRFSKVPIRKRQEIMLSWSRSYFFLLRIFYTAIKIFTLLLFFTQVDEKNENHSWKAIGYSKPDPKSRKPGMENHHENKEQCSDEKEQFGPLYKGIIELGRSKDVAINKLRKTGFPVSTPLSNKSKNTSLVIKCDVVVVGSGSGGGVAAGVLAEAGYKVVVLEKGSYKARNNICLLEGQAMDEMYLGHGLLATEHMDILLLAGSTVGGGSTINWSASIRTPPQVRKDWSQNHELQLFDSQLYEKALDVVSKKMGVQSEVQCEGFNNMILRKGCENLGYPVENIPRNAPSDHYCGWCSLGCKDGKKKGTSETWLVDLVESGNGAILAECEATKVIVEREKAVGVAFVYKNHGVEETAIVESKVTIIACGALSTPPLLKRSGIKNRNIGRNLHLHPVVLAWGYFPPDAWPEAVKTSYEGGIMTAMSNVVPNTIIQTPSLHPGMFSALMPWLSGSDIKNRMCKFSRTAHLFTLTRDKGSGIVSSPSEISYKMDDSDQENLSKGMEAVLRILAGAGAEEIGTHHREGRVLNVKKASRDEFERFVKEESSKPLKNLSSPICSAHQMGSCRMGIDPKKSVVNPNGECWDVEGLYIADSSVFPTALGVNPMLTVQAIAYCTAQSVVHHLATKKLGLASLRSNRV